MTCTSLIVAVSQNNVIGRDNDLIWHISEDLKRFKALTLGKPCIMGRKTFESILNILGKPLPGRTSITVSRSGYSYPGTPSASSLEDALAQAKQINAEEVIIAGGAQIYKEALEKELVDRLYLTRVLKEYEGDAFFPKINMDNWSLIEDMPQDTSPPCQFMTLSKKKMSL